MTRHIKGPVDLERHHLRTGAPTKFYDAQPRSDASAPRDIRLPHVVGARSCDLLESDVRELVLAARDQGRLDS